jgi:DNA-directed RNA polymerase specialized sigma24 family protein
VAGPRRPRHCAY